MVLYQNSFIVLNYEPSADILTVDWPQVESYLLHEVDRALQTLVEYVRNYDIKRLLIDASQANSAPGLIDSPEYKKIVMLFVVGLTNTRLQKSARIVATDKNIEAKTQKLSSEITQQTAFPIQNRDFESKAEARTWLLA